jgi:hypothetical protein
MGRSWKGWEWEGRVDGDVRVVQRLFERSCCCWIGAPALAAGSECLVETLCF